METGWRTAPSEHRPGVTLPVTLSGTLPVTLAAFRLALWFCPATAGSVLGASTSAEIADVFSGLKDRERRCLLGGGELAVYVFHIRFDPSNAGDFDLAILSDQEQSGDIGQAVGIGHRVAVRIVQQSAEGNAVLFQKGGGVALVILRDAYDCDFLVAVRFVEAFEVGKSVLAGWTGNLEEDGEHRPLLESGLQIEFTTIFAARDGGQGKVRRFGSGRQC